MAGKRVLVTGGAGFIGRWTVKRFLEKGWEVNVLDDLSNGARGNLEEFSKHPGYRGLIVGDIRDRAKCHEAMEPAPELVIHAAAQINVQSSLDDPQRNYEVNVLGTHNLLEEAKAILYRNAGVTTGKVKDAKAPMVVMIGTCMVYEMASKKAMSEKHPVKPASPYAASKLAGEYLAESYYHGFGLPVTILRPFNTYGPFQKSNMEGGVVSIFVKRELDGQDLNIFGTGRQTRDLLYVEDCAEFIYKASQSSKAVGELFNAGTGRDVTINALATMIAGDKKRIKHVQHHHPQSEVMKLQCDPRKAIKVLKWKPDVPLEKGIEILRKWFKEGNTS